MKDKDLMIAKRARFSRLVDLLDNAEDDHLSDESSQEYLTCSCGDKYPANMAEITANNCPGCFSEKELGILPDSPDSYGPGVTLPETSNPDYFPTDHPVMDRAVKAHEETGGVFNLGKKLV